MVNGVPRLPEVLRAQELSAQAWALSTSAWDRNEAQELGIWSQELLRRVWAPQMNFPGTFSGVGLCEQTPRYSVASLREGGLNLRFTSPKYLTKCSKA